MSSWLSLSLPNNPFFNSFQKQQEEEIEDDDDHHDRNLTTPPPTTAKDDLSAVLGRQLRGVAAFLAPPPTSSADTPSSSDTLIGIKKDFVEIGGSFKTTLSLLSSNKAVAQFSRFATNFLQFRGGEEEVEEEEDAVGITDEVVEFIGNISKRPEFWTEFPLQLDNDFNISDVQREHIATIKDLVPSLAALRHEICSNLSDERFWMIYFILLLPRLNDNDSKLLSTPEIVEVRDILLQKLHSKNNAEVSENPEVPETVKTFQNDDKDNSTRANECPSHGNEVLTEVVSAAKCLKIDYHENTKWYEEEGGDTGTKKQSEDDISFSDLEEDDSDLLGKRPGFRQADIHRVPSYCESNEWVQLNDNLRILGGQQKAVESTTKEKYSESESSNDWLTIDDIDLDRPAAV